MPFVAAAGAIAAAASAAGAVGVWTATQYAVAAISMHYANRKAKRQAGAADRLARQGRAFDIRNTVTSRSLIVGRAAVPIERVVFRKAHGDNRELMTFIACFGAHEIDGVEDILFNGESVGNMALRDGAGWYTDPNSKYVKTTRRLAATGGDQWPSSGGTVQLPVNAEAVISVAVLDSDQSIDLRQGVDYSVGTVVLGGGTVTTITAIGSAWSGLTYRITYRVVETNSLVRAQVYRGLAAGERDAYAENIPVQNPNPEPDDPVEQIWTANHLLKGQPRVSFTLKWDADVFGPVGFPEIVIVTRGARCYDFVAQNTTWTNNPARIAAWYLMRPEGFGAELSDIDTNLAIAAQNACDESVPYGPTGSQNQPRYRCDGIIDVEANPIENLNDVLGSMAGDAVPVGSSWDLYAGVVQTPLYTLTDKDLAGGPEQFRPDSGLGERVNCVRGTFIDATNGYKARDIELYESPTYINQDGGEKAWLDIALPMTTDPWAAQRIARLRLHQLRNAATWTTTYNLGAYPVRAGQTIRCQHTEYGWDTMESGAGKRFSVMSRRMNASGDIELAMMETAASIYSWNYDEAKEPNPTPNTDFPDPTYVEPVTLHAPVSNSGTYDVGTNGEKIPYVLLSWDALPAVVAQTADRIEVEWKGSGELSYRTERLTPDQTDIKLRPVWGGMLISGSVRVINALGVSSDPAFFEHGTSPDIPGNIQGTAGGNLVANAGFDWDTEGFNRFGGGPNDTFSRWAGVGSFRPDRPAVAMLDQRPGSTGSIGVNTPLINCDPGKRYLVMARIHSFRSRAWVALAFANEAHQHVGQTNSLYTTSQPDEPGALDQFETRYAFVTAPPTARKMLFQFGKLQTEAPYTSSWARIYQPMVCEIVGGDFIPPWAYGPIHRIAPGQMPPGSATIIARATPLGTIDVPLNGGFPLAAASLTIPPFPVAHQLRISARWIGMRAGSTTGEFVQIQAIGHPGGTSLRVVDLLPRSSVDPYTEERTTQVIVSRAANTPAWEVSLRPRFLGAGSVTMTGVEFTVEFIAS